MVTNDKKMSHFYPQETLILLFFLGGGGKGPHVRRPSGEANYSRYLVNSSTYSKNDLFQKYKGFKHAFTINSLISREQRLWLCTVESINNKLKFILKTKTICAVIPFRPWDWGGVLCRFKYSSECHLTISTLLSQTATVFLGETQRWHIALR